MKKFLLALGIIGILFSMSFTTLASEDQTSTRLLTADIFEPFVGESQIEIAPRAIFGKDRRKRVSSSQLRQHPYNAVALLKVEYPNRTVYASGFFYDNTTVITAGHCIYMNKLGGLANKITVYTSTGEAYEASSFTYNPAWDGGSSSNVNDYGIIKISDYPGSKFGGDFTRNVTDGNLYLTGYPDNNTIMYTAHGKAKSNGNTWFKHTIDMTPGQSGSPIYYKTDKGGFVVGINTGEIENQYNFAIRFTRAVHDWCVNT